jgi:hypothetical protein
LFTALRHLFATILSTKSSTDILSGEAAFRWPDRTHHPPAKILQEHDNVIFTNNLQKTMTGISPKSQATRKNHAHNGDL